MMKRGLILLMVLTIAIFNTNALKAEPFTYGMNGELEASGADSFGIDGEMATLIFTADDSPHLTHSTPGQFASQCFRLTDATLTIGANTYTPTAANSDCRLYNYFTTNTFGTTYDFIDILIYSFQIPDTSSTMKHVDLIGRIEFNTLDFWTDSEVPPTHKPFGLSSVDSTELDFRVEYNENPDYRLINSQSGAAPVPEPATMLLFGAGLAGFGVFRKKLKRT